MHSTDESIVSPPRLYLLVENPKKSNNLGPILRCAAAFGTAQVIAVGFDKCATEGSHGAAKHVSLIAFPTVQQAVSHLRSQGCTSLIGVLGGVANSHNSNGYSVEEDEGRMKVAVETHETTPSAKRSYPIHARPFVEGNCCFVISKNWKGLPTSLANECDLFVHVPQADLSSDEESSSGRLLDAPSCLSIALHHFTAWAKYEKRDFQGHKFEVGGREPNNVEKQATRSARAEARRQMELADALVNNPLGCMFGAEPSDDY